MSVTGPIDWAIVTGSAGAIGSELCSRLLANAVAVAGLDVRTPDPLPQNLVANPVDLRDAPAFRDVLRALLDQFGPPRYLVMPRAFIHYEASSSSTTVTPKRS